MTYEGIIALKLVSAVSLAALHGCAAGTEGVGRGKSRPGTHLERGLSEGMCRGVGRKRKSTSAAVVKFWELDQEI